MQPECVKNFLCCSTFLAYKGSENALWLNQCSQNEQNNMHSAVRGLHTLVEQSVPRHCYSKCCWGFAIAHVNVLVRTRFTAPCKENAPSPCSDARFKLLSSGQSNILLRISEKWGVAILFYFLFLTSCVLGNICFILPRGVQSSSIYCR